MDPEGRPHRDRQRDQHRHRPRRGAALLRRADPRFAGAELPAQRRAPLRFPAAGLRPRQPQRLPGGDPLLLEHRAQSRRDLHLRREHEARTGGRRRVPLSPARLRRRGSNCACCRTTGRTTTIRAMRSASSTKAFCPEASTPRRGCCASPTTTTGRTFPAIAARRRRGCCSPTCSCIGRSATGRPTPGCSAGRCCRPWTRRPGSTRRPTSGCRRWARATPPPGAAASRSPSRASSTASPTRTTTISRPRQTGDRFHALGSISRPFYTPGWTFVPKVSFNAASYSVDQPLPDGRRSASRVIPTLSIDSAWALERDTRLFGKAFRETLEPRLFYVNTPFRSPGQPAELRCLRQGLQLRLDLHREHVLGHRPGVRCAPADRRPDVAAGQSANGGRGAAPGHHAALPVQRSAGHARWPAADPALLRHPCARLDLAGAELDLRRPGPVQPGQPPDRPVARGLPLFARAVPHPQHELPAVARPVGAGGGRLAVADLRPAPGRRGRRALGERRRLQRRALHRRPDQLQHPRQPPHRLRSWGWNTMPAAGSAG